MKIFSKIKTVALVSVLVSGTAFAAVNQQASNLATKLYCDVKGAEAAISEQTAAQNAATQLGVGAGTEILVDTSCGTAAAAGSTGGGAATTSSFTTIALIGGGIAVLAAAASGGGDNGNASP